MYIDPKQLFKKGTDAFVYNIYVDGIAGRESREFDLIVGEDILTEESDYIIKDGEQFVTYKQIENEVMDYVAEHYPYPEGHNFVFEVYPPEQEDDSWIGL